MRTRQKLFEAEFKDVFFKAREKAKKDNDFRLFEGLLLGLIIVQSIVLAFLIMAQ